MLTTTGKILAIGVSHVSNPGGLMDHSAIDRRRVRLVSQLVSQRLLIGVAIGHLVAVAASTVAL